jgi:hypothetical protein
MSLDSPSPWGSGSNAPDVVVNSSTRVNSLMIPATEGSLVSDSVQAMNGTESEGGDHFFGWGVDRRDGVQNFYLRIMPLGASITQGIASTDANGYRKHIRDQLRYIGWNVNMVGSKQDGTMADRVNYTFIPFRSV